MNAHHGGYDLQFTHQTAPDCLFPAGRDSNTTHICGIDSKFSLFLPWKQCLEWKELLFGHTMALELSQQAYVLCVGRSHCIDV
jgi:hypothetical protein